MNSFHSGRTMEDFWTYFLAAGTSCIWRKRGFMGCSALLYMIVIAMLMSFTYFNIWIKCFARQLCRRDFWIMPFKQVLHFVYLYLGRDSLAPACQSADLFCTVYFCAVLGELTTSWEWIPLSWRGSSPVFCSLDLADTVLTDLRTGRMIDFGAEN